MCKKLQSKKKITVDRSNYNIFYGCLLAYYLKYIQFFVLLKIHINSINWQMAFMAMRIEIVAPEFNIK